MTEAVDPTAFRKVAGCFATGVVAVVGFEPETARPQGLAVNAFASVSLAPPLVAFCVSCASTSWPAVRASGVFCVNVLAWRQRPLCERLARRGGDKFAGAAWSAGRPCGDPVLAGVVAWLKCVIEAEHAAGDHTIVVSRVLDLGTDEAPDDPLLFYRGDYRRLDPELEH